MGDSWDGEGRTEAHLVWPLAVDRIWQSNPGRQERAKIPSPARSPARMVSYNPATGTVGIRGFLWAEKVWDSTGAEVIWRAHCEATQRGGGSPRDG